MITIRKLQSMKPSTALRKCAYVFHEAAADARQGISPDIAYIGQVLQLVIRLDSDHSEISGFYREKHQALGLAGLTNLPWLLEDLYFHILGRLGVSTADWDLQDITGGNLSRSRREVLPIRPYLDRIRSPFNVGSVFRTAESFCCDRVLLAAETASPEHPRAIRTARGCTETVPWSLCGLESLSEMGPVFALETGGTMLDDFSFPREGTVIVGTEEMGVSPDALALADCSLGRVTIPTYGAKGSLNVSVAFGILMQAWTAALHKD